MALEAPPISQPIAEGQPNAADLRWLIFFNQMFEGDAGTSWTPTFQNLANTGGAPTITGKYYRISQYLTFFSVRIVPVTNTSSTAGSTYIDNFPLTISQDSVCFASVGTSGGLGGISSSDRRIYTPTWTSITTPVTVNGLVEAR